MHVLPTSPATSKPSFVTLLTIMLCFACFFNSAWAQTKQQGPSQIGPTDIAPINTGPTQTAPYSHAYYEKTTIADLSVPDEAVSFLTLGDWGRNGHFYQKHVAKWLDIASYQLDAEFIATTGDNFYDNGIASVDDPYWISSYEAVYHQPHLFINWHPVLGNHDYRGNWQAQIDYSLKSRRWEMPAQYYSKTLALDDGATALLLFIDTSPLNPDYAREAKYQEAYEQGASEQLSWINTMLAQDQYTWKVVIGHHPLYSSGKRYGKTNAIKDVLEPVFHKHNVNLYIAGHEHDLQHNQLAGDELVHVVSGGGSEVRPVGNYEFTQFAKSTGGFVSVSMTAKSIFLNYIDHQGKKVYAHTINKPNTASSSSTL
ncbi:metallophosphoesterase [Alteromonas mediterranea]|uniref:metallophosphoesterase n=1 Tax=Alteromonas mediterranea TaxID=314275 RepID=UPI001E5F8A09|nr:metallophosphoesterase [Alteromonas mediterranea]